MKIAGPFSDYLIYTGPTLNSLISVGRKKCSKSNKRGGPINCVDRKNFQNWINVEFLLTMELGFFFIKKLHLCLNEICAACKLKSARFDYSGLVWRTFFVKILKRLSLSADLCIHFYWLSRLRQASHRKIIQKSALRLRLRRFKILTCLLLKLDCGILATLFGLIVQNHT